MKILGFIFSLSLMGCSSNLNNENLTMPKTNIAMGSEIFSVEIASTKQEQAKGLSKRNFLNKKEGMLFVFEDEQIRYFWMKDTYITLDILFFDSNMKLIAGYENVQPCKQFFCPNYSSLKPSKYVLELNGGTIQNLIENKIINPKNITIMMKKDTP